VAKRARVRKRPTEGDTAHNGAEHRAGWGVKASVGGPEAVARQEVQALLERMIEEDVAAMRAPPLRPA
jgi:hypothetical protein